MVVLAVQTSVMANVVRGAYCASSLAALEAAFMVRTAVHRHLHKPELHSFTALFFQPLNIEILLQ